MNFPHPDEPLLEVGLNNQQSILHQLYNLVISMAQTREYLERSWKTLVQEEEREILWRQRREERKDRRNQRLARETQAHGRD
jgi:hypothetical protein